jgi:hypothetical protein
VKAALLVLLVIASIALVIAPAWILNPFAPETARGLQAAYTARHAAPLITIAFAAVALIVVWSMWRNGGRWWRKALMIVAVLLIGGSALLARQNHFEWMFAPLHDARFVRANDASFVDGDDMVLAVAQKDEAAAYPIRQLAYHHIVHDTVGGVPLVVTY